MLWKVAVGSLLILLASACAPAQAPAPTASPVPTQSALTRAAISVASPSVSGVPLYVAIQEGFMKAHGVDLTPQPLASNVGQTALMQGEIQFLSSPTDAITAAANGLPFKVVYVAWERAPWTLIGKAEYTSVTDLRGKTIGTNRPGTAPYSYLDAGLRKAGLTVSDVSILYLTATQDDYAALIAGQLDAAVVSPPFDLQAAEQGFHEIAFLGDELQVPYIGLATSAPYIHEHRDVVVNVIRAMLDAKAWIRDHPDGAVNDVRDYLGLSPEIATAAYQKMVGSQSISGEARPEGITQQLGILSTALNKPVQLDPADAVDYGPLHEAMAGR